MEQRNARSCSCPLSHDRCDLQHSAKADVPTAHPQELSRSQQQEMVAVLGLLRQYADTAASCAAPPFIVGQCAEPLQRLQRALIDNGPLQTWQPDAVQLLQCLLQFYTVLLQRCQVRLRRIL